MFAYSERKDQSFDFTETKKVFDTSIYKKYPLKKRAWIIAHDLAGLVLEAGDRNLEERINPWYIAITSEGKIVNLTSREEVTVNFGNNSELSINETAGAKDFYYNKALNAVEGDFILSFSPSGGNSPYKESRINIAKVRNLLGMKVLECYGIPSQFSPQEILFIANKFLAKNGENLIFNPEDLRKIAILTNNLESLHLDSHAWQEILKGTPREIKNKAFWDALPIAKNLSFELEFAKHEQDFVHSGAKAERLIQESGWKINSYQCVGSLNSQLEIKFGNYMIDGMGNFRKVNKNHNWEWKIGDCVRCSAKSVEVGPCKICRKCNAELDKEAQFTA